MPGTCTGMAVSPVLLVATPSRRLSPQHQAVPSALTAQAWFLPVATATALVSAGTLVGVAALMVEPVPKHQTVLSNLTAHDRYAELPALTPIASVSPGTVSGVEAWPSAPLPSR